MAHGAGGELPSGAGRGDGSVLVAAQPGGDMPGNSVAADSGVLSHSSRHPTWIPKKEHRDHIDASFLRGKRPPAEQGSVRQGVLSGLLGKKVPQVGAAGAARANHPPVIGLGCCEATWDARLR